MTRQGASQRGTTSGTWLVGGLVGLGLAAAATGIWYQRHQTSRCLAFYGPPAARRITAAPRVRLMLLEPSSREGRLVAVRTLDVSKAPGLVHLRRGLVEDANFAWSPERTEEDRGASQRMPQETWTVALVFGAPAPADGPVDPAEETAVVIGFSGPDAREVVPESGSASQPGANGFLTVAGQPGRLGLGRIGRGLQTWVRATLVAERGDGAGQGPGADATTPAANPAR